MVIISRTWWGEKFLEALEEITDYGRLQRGRSYSKPNRLLKFEINNNKINSRIRGNINHYFGVYEEPKYDVKIELKAISEAKWKKIIKRLAIHSGWLTKLLINEMPDDIDEAFKDSGVLLLPGDRSDLKTKCSCPDYANPCKHIAGTYYKVASCLDTDPFLLFELRGIKREKIFSELAKTSLGKALVAEISQTEVPSPKQVLHRFTNPVRKKQDNMPSLKEFWQGSTSVPKIKPASQQHPGVAALLIKKQGDYPAFWKKDNSFLDSMTEVYESVRKKNIKIL
jgi:uncharacterized Zn finger protein